MNKPLFRSTNIFRLIGIILLIASAFFSTPELAMLGVLGQAMAVTGIVLLCGPTLREIITGNGTVRSHDDFVSFWRWSNLVRLLGLVPLGLSIFFQSPMVDIKGVGGQVLPLSGTLLLCGPTLAELYRAVKERFFPRPKPDATNEGGIP